MIGFLVTLNSYSQNDSIIKNGFVSIATLIVDYSTNDFDGGNISYYSCADCDIDSIPISVDYDSPGDFGGVTFKLSSLQDTIFDATIIWMGIGQINYPNEFSELAPFTNTNIAINKPNDFRYIGTDGNSITDDYLINKANSAWNTIDSLEITNLFAEKGFKSAIYLYPPTVGMFDPNAAKWIIFLYHNDQLNAIDSNSSKRTQLQITPNPTNGEVTIVLNLTNLDKTNYKIFNQSGQLVAKGEFLGCYYQLDMSLLNSGLYFLHLSDKNNKIIAIEKIIIEQPCL